MCVSMCVHRWLCKPFVAYPRYEEKKKLLKEQGLTFVNQHDSINKLIYYVFSSFNKTSFCSTASKCSDCMTHSLRATERSQPLSVTNPACEAMNAYLSYFHMLFFFPSNETHFVIFLTMIF